MHINAVHITEVTFEDAAAGPVNADQRDFYRLTLAGTAENAERNAETSFEDFARRAGETGPDLPARRLLLARTPDGEAAATASLILPRRENTHMVGVGVYVVPGRRRRGIARALMVECLAGVRGTGREIVWVGAVGSGSPGEAVAAALGLRPVYSYVRQVLEIEGADPAAWRAEPPAGFRLELWTDAAPEALVESYARARSAIGGAPLQRSVLRYPEWTVERVRAHEERWRRLGERHAVMAAVHEESGEVAAITELSYPSADAKRIEQQYTTVLPAFRRRGLAVWIKGAMMLWLVERHPRARLVATGTAADNAGMIAVNARIGYRTIGAWTNYEAELAQVEARLGASPGSSRSPDGL
ncbi:GNAT family N-acetyltransferase [Actinospica durhamensis]|uniref:GNAT family N-acetyltransferase n=1 Tax=Actinospica durhamensis TaxID=1508375 RepID=A0A941IPK5_9ACTN|nr:GNAT family N-acetyltransferase [Actinospica durhamensis]MBR7836640.1 GNAT family N-acetyltransferase [Actinospica durhamensis]